MEVLMTKVSSNKGAKKLAKLLFLILGLALFINGIISTHFSGMGWRYSNLHIRARIDIKLYMHTIYE